MLHCLFTHEHKHNVFFPNSPSLTFLLCAAPDACKALFKLTKLHISEDNDDVSIVIDIGLTETLKYNTIYSLLKCIRTETEKEYIVYYELRETICV